MAGGWTRDGAVNEQIEATIQDELSRIRSLGSPGGESLRDCAECGEPIPAKRRLALRGVTLCIDCQRERDALFVARPGINRRASKDSQLK